MDRKTLIRIAILDLLLIVIIILMMTLENRKEVPEPESLRSQIQTR